MALKRWDVTVELAKRFGLKTFAEIGVRYGKHVEQILLRVPESTVIAVDPWADWSLPNSAECEAVFDKRTKLYRGRVTKHKMLGVEAALLYPDGWFDFVFIDDDHTYDVTRANVAAWLPKVSAGGIIAGHDYRNGFPAVDKVVEETFGADFNVEQDSVWWVKL